MGREIRGFLVALPGDLLSPTCFVSRLIDGRRPLRSGSTPVRSEMLVFERFNGIMAAGGRRAADQHRVEASEDVVGVNRKGQNLQIFSGGYI